MNSSRQILEKLRIFVCIFDLFATCTFKLDTCTVEIRSSEHRTWWEPLASIVADAVAAGGCVNGVEEPFKQFFRGAVAQLPARASVPLASGKADGVCKNAPGWPCRRPRRALPGSRVSCPNCSYGAVCRAAVRLPRWTANSRPAWRWLCLRNPVA